MSKFCIYFFAVIAVGGVVASLWNWGHLFFTAMPGVLLSLASYFEYRRDKRLKETYPLNNSN